VRIIVNVVLRAGRIERPLVQCKWVASPDAVPLGCVRRNFRYAHYVTTYLTFRRGWRAICAHSRCGIQKGILWPSYFQVLLYRCGSLGMRVYL